MTFSIFVHAMIQLRTYILFFIGRQVDFNLLSIEWYQVFVFNFEFKFFIWNTVFTFDNEAHNTIALNFPIQNLAGWATMENLGSIAILFSFNVFSLATFNSTKVKSNKRRSTWLCVFLKSRSQPIMVTTK